MPSESPGLLAGSELYRGYAPIRQKITISRQIVCYQTNLLFQIAFGQHVEGVAIAPGGSSSSIRRQTITTERFGRYAFTFGLRPNVFQNVWSNSTSLFDN